MRFDAITLGATLAASGVAATSHRHGHHHPIRRTDELHALHGAEMAARDVVSESQPSLEKRKKTCSLPSGEGLVNVPGASNGGWAMSPDQACTADMYCPYACPPGQVMAQWKPGSKFVYPSSMDGGVYCNKNGEVEKPFPEKPYCVDGTGTVKAKNKAGKALSFCQTVLPGNEAMLIPTVVDSSATLAVPDPSYWCSTSSHFYINPPGVGSEGCIWGTDSEAIGNWTPYVAGANTGSDGNTYLKIGWNPEWLKSGLKGTAPNYGLEIECEGGGCNGLPCSISPDDINGVNAPSSGEIADTGSFCVCTIPKGSSASIVVTGGSGSSSVSASSAGEEDISSYSSEEQPPPQFTQQQPPPPAEYQSKTLEATPSQPVTLTMTDDGEEDDEKEDEKPETTTQKKTPTPTPTPTSTSTKTSEAETTPTTMSSKVVTTTSSETVESATSSTSNAEKPQNDEEGSGKAAIFFEHDGNSTTSTHPTAPSSPDSDDTSAFAAAAPSDTQKDEGVTHQGGPIASLVIALVVGLYLF